MSQLPVPELLPTPDAAQRLLERAAVVLGLLPPANHPLPPLEAGPALARAAAAAPAWGMVALGSADLPSELLPWLQPGRVAVALTSEGVIGVVAPRLGELHVHREGGVTRSSPRAFQSARLGLESRWLLLEPTEPAALLAPVGAPVPWRRLWGLLRAEREDVALVLVYGAAAGLLSLAVPLMAQVLTNTIAFGAFQQPVLALAVGLLLCLLVAAGLRAAQHLAVEWIERRLFVRTADDVVRRLERVKVEKLDAYHAPELVNRFFDVVTVQKALGVLLLDGVAAALQGLAGLMLLGLYHPALLSFDLVLVGVALAIVVLPLWRGQQSALAESNAKYALVAWLQEVARTPGVHRLGGAQLSRTRTAALTRAWLAARDTHFRLHFSQFGGALFLQALASAVLLGLGGWLVVGGQLTLGQLVAAELVVASLLVALAKFAEKLESVYDLLAGLDKLGKLVDLPVESGLGEVWDTPERPIRLDLRGVALQEGGPTWNLSLPPGQVGAVLVRDPETRRRLAEAVSGQRALSGGWLAYDGVHVGGGLTDAASAGVMTLAPDDLLAASVRENLTLARPGLGGRELEGALRAVGLVTGKLPLGLDDELKPGGRALPGPLTARLLVARALLAPVRLLVLDGLLDDLEDAERTELIRALTQQRGSATLLVLTGDSALANALQQQSQKGGGAA